MEELRNLFDEIMTSCENFEINARACVNDGNKSAGRRARKDSLVLEKLFKTFRKLSVANENNPNA